MIDPVNEANTRVRSLSSAMIDILQESASFNQAFSSVEPTYCRGGWSWT